MQHDLLYHGTVVAVASLELSDGENINNFAKLASRYGPSNSGLYGFCPMRIPGGGTITDRVAPNAYFPSEY